MTALAAEARPPTPAESPRGSPAGRPPAAAKIVVLATIAGVGLLATWNSVHKSMWVDEGYSWYTATLPILGTFRRALRYELQPPLYFVLLNWWLRIEPSVVFGRLLSTITVMAFVAVMAGIGRRLGLRRWPLAAVLVAALPGVLWAASEMRGYGLTLLVAACTWYFFLGVTQPDREPTRSDLVGYTVAAATLLQCFYYGAFVLFGQWVAAGVTRRRWGRVTVLLAISSLALASFVSTIQWQVESFHDRSLRLDLLTDPQLALWTTAATFVRGAAAEAPILAAPHAIGLAMAVVLLVPLVRAATARHTWSRNEVLVVVAAGVPVICVGALRLFNISAVLPRHTLVTLPGIAILMALWIEAIGSTAVRRAVTAVVVVTVIAGLASYERSGLQREDWRAAANYVTTHAKPGDVVLIYDPDRVLPFGYYYHGPAPVFGIPIDAHLNAYTPAAYLIRDTAQIGARVAASGADRHGAWLVTADHLLLPLQHGPSLIAGYMRAHHRLDASVDFEGVRVAYAHAP